MPLKEKTIKKIYYSIGEVATMFDVNKSLIRFWEKEFSIIKPKKNKKGNRYFTERDINNFKIIFHLVKERIESGIEQNPRGLIRKYSSELRKAKTKKDETISKYALHLAYLNNKDYSKAFSLIRECIELDPININLQISLMEAHMKAGNILESVSLGKNLISLHPNNYSISLLLSKALFRDKKYDEAEEILNDISKKRPADPFVWYELAEVQGFSNNLIGLHRSRAEYFFLTGRFEAAIMQLREASKLATNFFEVSESIRTRMEEIYQTTEALKRMG